MKILQGIQLYVAPEVDLSEPRLWLNSGVTPIVETDQVSCQYSKDAFIPIDSWREPTPLQKKRLWSDRVSKDISRWVYVINLPQQILDLFRELHVDSLIDQEESFVLTATPGYKHALDRVFDYLNPFCLKNHKPTLAGIGISPPGLATVTFNRMDGHYIGLHLDSWDHLPLAQRHHSTNRICFNLGREDRFLLFINLTLMDIFYLLKMANSIDFQKDQWWTTFRWTLRRYHLPLTQEIAKMLPQNLIQQFLRKYPFYPVVKVRIRPGEAYIAPTENMIHDGCSLGQTYADIQLTLRGYFKLPQLPRNAYAKDANAAPKSGCRSQ